MMKKIKFIKLDSRQRVKFGDFIIDVAKYLLTAVVIATFFDKESHRGGGFIIITALLVMCMVVFGLYLNKKNSKN